MKTSASTLPVLRSFSSCGTRTKGTSAAEVERDRGHSGARSPTTLPASGSVRLWPPSSSVPTPPLANSFIAVPVKSCNFGRALLVSLGPPYFQTQGGLQKYVGGATSDVTGVRGLARLISESSLGSCTLLFDQQRFFLKSGFACGVCLQDDAFGCTVTVLTSPVQSPRGE